MLRLGLIAALAGLLHVPGWAQARAGHVGSAHTPIVAQAVGMPATAGRIGAFGRGFPRGGFGHSGAFPFHHHHFFGARFNYWGYPWAYSYYPGWSWDYPDYDQSSYQDQQLQAYQTRILNNQQQTEQRIASLEERLDRLYQQRSAMAQPAQVQAQSKGEHSQSAILVFNDGHQQEIQNYAIVGQTIWILNEQQAKKIPLSALDLAATRKANADRQAGFELPGSSG